MALVASTLLDLVKNLRAFAGILVVSFASLLSDCCPVRLSHLCSRCVQVVYYVFAVFGIWLFEGVIKPPPEML